MKLIPSEITCRCGKVARHGRRRCESCHARATARRDSNRADGKCWCGRESRKGFVTCEPCAASSKMSSLRNRAKKSPEVLASENHQRKCAAHGITPVQYAYLLERQGGVCAICQLTCAHYANLAIDHDHSHCPGVYGCEDCIRGLLCNNCNRAMGMFGDNAEKLARAAAYLSENRVAGVAA